MKKVLLLLFLLGIIITCIIVVILRNKSQIEIKESVTDQNGIALFKDKDTREKVEVVVKNQLGENLKDIHVGYIDGDEFELFLCEDPLKKYLPALEIYPHNSVHDITMSFKENGPTIEEYRMDEKKKSLAVEMFLKWFFKRSQVVDHGVMTLEEWDYRMNINSYILSLFIPRIGNKMEVIGTVKQIIDVLAFDGSYTNPKGKFHIYSYLPFNSINSLIYIIEESEDEENENSEIGKPIEVNYDLAERYFPLQIGNHWKYKTKECDYGAELPDDVDNYTGSGNVEIYIDRKEIVDNKVCFVMKEGLDEKYFSHACGLISVLKCNYDNTTGNNVLLAYEKIIESNGGRINFPEVYLTTYSNQGILETVNVQAGEYHKALKIENRFSNNEIDVVLTEWLVENIGVVKGKLKTEYKIGVPSTTLKEWELCSYSINKEDEPVVNNIRVDKSEHNANLTENDIIIWVGKKLISYGSEKVISFTTQKIAEKIIQKGSEKAVEETSKRIVSKLAGKIIGKAGGFIIGFLMDIPSVGSDVKVNTVTEPAATFLGDITIKADRRVKMDIELYPGDRTGSLIIKFFRSEPNKTNTLLSEMQYHCIGTEGDFTYKFGDINIQYKEEGTYIIQVFFPENELRNQYKVISDKTYPVEDNFIGTWRKIGGGTEYDPHMKSYLDIRKENEQYYVSYVTWHDAYRYHKIRTSKINGDLVGGFYEPNSVIVKLTEPDKLLFTIDPFGEFMPIKVEIYIRDENFELIPDQDEFYCEVVFKEDNSNRIPVRAYSKDGNIYVEFDDSQTKQLTFSGHDYTPVLSPDKSAVAFIRVLENIKIENASGGEEENKQIWIYNINENSEELLVKSNDYPGVKIIGGLKNLNYTPDSRYLYFMDIAATVTDKICRVDVSSKRVESICSGNSLEVIQKGNYSGYLIVTRHKYYEEGGSYDYYWLLSPEGKEIKLAGKDDNELLEFKKKEIYQ